MDPRTVLFELRLVHLKLQPRPVDHLVCEDGPEKDLGKGAGEQFVAAHLWSPVSFVDRCTCTTGIGWKPVVESSCMTARDIVAKRIKEINWVDLHPL